MEEYSFLLPPVMEPEVDPLSQTPHQQPPHTCASNQTNTMTYNNNNNNNNKNKLLVYIISTAGHWPISGHLACMYIIMSEQN